MKTNRILPAGVVAAVAVAIGLSASAPADARDVKGGGGAHTREKIVNRHARQNVIIVDDSKLSDRLGEKRAVVLRDLIRPEVYRGVVSKVHTRREV